LQAGCQRFESVNLHLQKQKKKRESNSAPVKDSLLKSRIFRKHLENCIIYQKKSGRNFNDLRKMEAVKSGKQSKRKEDNPKKQDKFVVKLQRAHGGYLGIQRR
jgi:hypothetical protein